MWNVYDDNKEQDVSELTQKLDACANIVSGYV